MAVAAAGVPRANTDPNPPYETKVGFYGSWKRTSGEILGGPVVGSAGRFRDARKLAHQWAKESAQDPARAQLYLSGAVMDAGNGLWEVRGTNFSPDFSGALTATSYGPMKALVGDRHWYDMRDPSIVLYRSQRWGNLAVVVRTGLGLAAVGTMAGVGYLAGSKHSW